MSVHLFLAVWTPIVVPLKPERDALSAVGVAAVDLNGTNAGFFGIGQSKKPGVGVNAFSNVGKL